MNAPFVIYRKNLETVRLSEGNGLLTRIITPDSVNSHNLYVGIGECAPGDTPHRWHSHTKDSMPEADYIYPEGFEEFYYVIRGTGTVQWKGPDDTIHEEVAGEGDTIFMPANVAQHQVLNTGKDTLTVLYGMSPPVQRIDK